MGLLQLPVEVVQRVFPYLALKDLRNFACCSSTLFKITIPILYRSFCIYFAEPTAEPIVSPANLETIMDLSDLTIRSFKKLYVSKIGSLKPRPLRPFISDMDDVMLRLILKKFGNGQLRTIRFENTISSRTLALILERQTNLNELEISDLGALRELYNPYIFPPSLFTQPLRLTSFSVGEILQWTALTVLKIVHQSASTLRKLRFGDPRHHDTSRLPIWEETIEPDSEMGSMPADSYGEPFVRREERHFAALRSQLEFGEINLPLLERLYIVHDSQFAKFMRFAIRMISNCHRLRIIRISSSNDPCSLVQRLVNTGSRSIESLQIGQCTDRTPSSSPSLSPPRVPQPLPRIPSLKTLQLTNDTHTSDVFANFEHPMELRRLWLHCLPAHCHPLECPIISRVFEYSDPLSRMSMLHENWSRLEELAIPHPGWSKVPLLPSLKVLRLLDWLKLNDYIERSDRHLDSITKMQAYVTKLYKFSDANYDHPPELKLIIMDEEYHANDCYRYKTLMDFPQCYSVEDGKIVMLRSRKSALRRCQEAGCSPYLVLGGLPTPEQVWGCEDKDYIYSEADYLPPI
ncbi:hypothetical protein TWF106_002196 [Orbilia oligospora]|uniref:Uncharacterized protein n=2 Tax=Orbilia oligospora TaxID=2813651 RepID=A0A6G1M871_ORBOL|nr:hypothetical protein TWF106_002196 [Orbilia oligospora]KAF3248281.1 hypothetical protein TWF192_006278 [Orbilia oligospora]